MRILLVHQNIPGQFRDLAPALCDRGHELKAIGSSTRAMDPRIEVLRYGVEQPDRQGIHRLSGEVDDWIRRAEQVAELATALRRCPVARPTSSHGAVCGWCRHGATDLQANRDVLTR